MSNLCANAVAVPLTFIFQNSLAADKFAAEWKKANIVPFHYDKQKVSTYLSTSISSAYMQCIKNFCKAYFQQTFQIFRG